MRATPFPNGLLESALRLPETQVRLILLVARNTLGYTAGPGERRAAVRLSHHQIGREIDRSSTAISGAIDGLVVRGLLEVTDGAGRPLTTGFARRALRAPLWFRFPSSMVEVVGTTTGETT